MDAPGGQRGEQPGPRIEHLDRDVVGRDEPPEAVGDALEDGLPVERREHRFGDLQQCTLAAHLALVGGRLRLQALGGIGVGHRLGGEARVDHEEAQVVVAELVQPKLRKDEHAEDLVLEHHRREEHRLVEVVLGAGDRVGPRVLRGVREVLRHAMLGNPAGDPLAQLDLQLFGRLVGVLADLALHRDRDQVVAVQAIDANVVGVDELAQLLGDREPDLLDVGQAVEPRAELLDRLELCRPGRHLLVVLGGPDGDHGARGQRGHRLQLLVGPVMRLVVVDVERAEELRPVEERRRADACRSPPGRRRPGRPHHADRPGTTRPRADGARRSRRPGWNVPAGRGRCPGRPATGRG